jgi:hypothetical protein
MKPVLLAMGSAFAVWAGMSALCFQSSNQRHRMGLTEQTTGERWRFMGAGTALLAISLIGAMAADGASFGIVLWLCQIGVLGFALICLLPYSIAWATNTSRIAAVIAPMLLVAGNFL